MGVIVTTSYGQLEGTEDEGVLRFRGIPFAQPPVGELRFRPPDPPEPWHGVRPAQVAGPTSLQGADMINQLFGAEPEPIDEDCLYLNVFTPALDDARRPVMFWIHGGGFIMGSGSSPMYDGASFARRGDVVYVSCNYRLGELGFADLGHIDASYAGSGNNGILDQIAALEWVRDNIAAFGGDPDNVTIFGESAGGMSVGTLLSAPRAAGLFHRAIAQSGAARNIVESKVAAEVTDDLMARLGATDVADLLAVPGEKLLEVRAGMLASAMADLDRIVAGEGPLLGLPFQPVADGVVLPDDPAAAIRGGSADVPLLVGTTRDEWKLFGLMDMGQLDEARLLGRVNAVAGDGRDMVAAYREEFPDLDPKALFGEVANDYAFRIPAVRLAEAQLEHRADVWMYLFDWKSRAFGGLLGACHGIELPFVFHNVESPAMGMFLGDGDRPTGLADQVQDAWLAFARHGDPNHPGLVDWPRYDQVRRATMTLAEPPRVVDDPMGGVRVHWDSVL